MMIVVIVMTLVMRLMLTVARKPVDSRLQRRRVELITKAKRHIEFTARNEAPVNEAESRRANSEAMRKEQVDDETLKGGFSLAKCGKGNFVIHDGILYRNEKILGQNFMQLCLPKGRRLEVFTMAHDMFGGHLGAKKTQERFRLSFAWPTLASDVKKYCESCETCQN
jgi:hypothetical protein